MEFLISDTYKRWEKKIHVYIKNAENKQWDFSTSCDIQNFLAKFNEYFKEQNKEKYEKYDLNINTDSDNDLCFSFSKNIEEHVKEELLSRFFKIFFVYCQDLCKVSIIKQHNLFRKIEIFICHNQRIFHVYSHKYLSQLGEIDLEGSLYKVEKGFSLKKGDRKRMKRMLKNTILKYIY